MIGIAMLHATIVGIGVFLAAAFVFQRQARSGNRDNLVGNSVLMTSVLTGMLAAMATGLLRVVL